SGDQLTLGERAADRMRNMMGSWPFVFSFFSIMIAWAVINSVFYFGGSQGKHGFDPYPYILLNLFLSMLAGVQAAALLIAAKRADAIASEIALHTEKNTEDIKSLVNENTALTELVKANTDLLEEIHRHVSALTPQAGKFAADEDPPPSAL
ncbi:MAG: Acid-resistant locus arl7, partial [Actinobacteria bacterium]|nr:Acid-resistant locus arl7 [Actinomycetota bacterium]